MARSERDREQIAGALRRELEARPEVVLALLHGSFSKGGAYRDIDVAVWLDPGRLSLDDRFRYALDLSVHLQLQLGSPIDVRVLNDASLAFRYHALQGRPLIHPSPLQLRLEHSPTLSGRAVAPAPKAAARRSPERRRLQRP